MSWAIHLFSGEINLETKRLGSFPHHSWSATPSRPDRFFLMSLSLSLSLIEQSTQATSFGLISEKKNSFFSIKGSYAGVLPWTYDKISILSHVYDVLAICCSRICRILAPPACVSSSKMCLRCFWAWCSYLWVEECLCYRGCGVGWRFSRAFVANVMAELKERKHSQAKCQAVCPGSETNLGMATVERLRYNIKKRYKILKKEGELA